LGQKAAEEKKGPKRWDKELEGDWELVSLVFSGTKLPGAPVVRITEDTINVKSEGRTIRRIPIEIYPTVKPRAIDLGTPILRERGPSSPGIYEVNGDELRICYAGPGKERPTEFTSERDSECFLITFRRIKR
jgi:uncharacterized protein (TIGR03067 family)